MAIKMEAKPNERQPIHSDLFPMPNDPLRCLWERVVVRGLRPDREMRPEVLRSWLRCSELGLDPFRKSTPPIISGPELERHLKRNRDLIEVSRPVMDMIEISVRQTGFVVTLTEKSGCVLRVSGDKEILAMAERNYYQPGCIRTIEHAGTNAIGVCLVELKPIQLTGMEHYNIHHHPWTCSSAPIFDGNGEVLGVITLSGRSVGQHKHTLALVTAAAETIESQLRERDLAEAKLRLSSMLGIVFNSISDGVIAVDNRLTITHINETAARMLDLKADSSVGKNIEEELHPETTLIRAFETRSYFTGTEIEFSKTTGHKRYICSVDPIRNAYGTLLGAIITLVEKRQVISIAKKIGGNYAKFRFEDIKGNDPQLLKNMRMASLAARTGSRVLIVGETGTGKELFAQAIHNESNRKDEPFVAISCASIPRDLIESELFGYRGGAFTGARRQGQIGKFELANRGTLFLDEVNGLPLDLQAKLLRVLQQREIVRLGDTVPIPIDVRVLAASNADLETEVENASFRKDLYFRLNVVELRIPPLRERLGDLPLLIDHIVKRLCQEMGIKLPALSDEVMRTFMRYQWPGNIRELENCMERALLLCQGDTIQIIHIPDRIRLRQDTAVFEPVSLHQRSKEIIEATLAECHGNVSTASKKLKIARSTLYRKMDQFGISKLEASRSAFKLCD
jgi:transcriptional regulator of acetoin/glycerol metabolism